MTTIIFINYYGTPIDRLKAAARPQLPAEAQPAPASDPKALFASPLAPALAVLALNNSIYFSVPHY